MKKIYLFLLGVSLAGCQWTQPNTVINDTTVVVDEVENEVELDTEDVTVEDSGVENVDTTNVELIVDAGVTWLDTPEPLEDLGLLADSENYQDIDQYYKVADLADGGEVIYFTRSEMGTTVNRFRKDGSGNYYLLANHSADYYSEDQDLLTDRITIDTTTTYQALQYPDELEVAGIPLQQQWLPFSFNDLFSIEDDNPSQPFTFLGDTAYGPVYIDTDAVVTTVADGSIESKSYVLKLADGSVVRYLAQKDFLADDGSLIADFTKGGINSSDQQFFVGMIASGCGVLGGDQYLVDMTPEALVTAGVTDSSDTLYTISDPDSTVLLNAYETYKIGRDFEGSTETLLTYEEFVGRTPIVVWQDSLGDYLVFMDKDFAPLVECGKPLIYLYPTEPTEVSVEVGADIRVSEPAYNNGWEVMAQPSGTELYWEGKGHGVYPDITFGRVVPKVQAELAIKSDLVKQGLTASEIKDFMEFWQPHLPNSRYVRLSWLNTEQMNQLAPLQITPKPDTLIRVFLDFAGQTTAKTNLTSQTLTSVPRDGFTVIEWGGLLLGQ